MPSLLSLWLPPSSPTGSLSPGSCGPLLAGLPLGWRPSNAAAHRGLQAWSTARSMPPHSRAPTPAPPGSGSLCPSGDPHQVRTTPPNTPGGLSPWCGGCRRPAHRNALLRPHFLPPWWAPALLEDSLTAVPPGRRHPQVPLCPPLAAAARRRRRSALPQGLQAPACSGLARSLPLGVSAVNKRPAPQLGLQPSPLPSPPREADSPAPPSS